MNEGYILRPTLVPNYLSGSYYLKKPTKIKVPKPAVLF